MASCPNCGFDLTEEGICPVCTAKGGGGHAARVRSGSKLRRSAVYVAAAAAAVIVAVVLIFAASSSRGPSSVAAVHPAAAAAPAAQPAVVPGAAAGAAAAQSDPPSYDITSHTAVPPTDTRESYINWMVAQTGQDSAFVGQRWDRAQVAIGRGDVKSKRVLDAFLMTPRENFVRSYNKPRSYADAAIPIGYGQTISGPHIVIRMTDALDPQPEQRVLEIGTGSGYQSAILSQLSNHVYTIEIVEPLYRETDLLYTSLSSGFPMYGNIARKNSDGYFGWPQAAPFDRIIVTAAIDHIPPDLLKELAPSGVMVIPVGPPSGQVVLKITKVQNPDGTFRLEREDIYHGQAKKIFVPFTAEGGGVHSLSTDRDSGQ